MSTRGGTIEVSAGDETEYLQVLSSKQMDRVRSQPTRVDAARARSFETCVLEAFQAKVASDYAEAIGASTAQTEYDTIEATRLAESLAIQATALTDEVSTLSSTATGGTFTMTVNGQTATGIAKDVSAAALKTALVALSNVDTADLTTSGGPLGTAPIVITWGGALANQDLAVSINGAGLTGGTATLTETTKGGR